MACRGEIMSSATIRESAAMLTAPVPLPVTKPLGGQ